MGTTRGNPVANGVDRPFLRYEQLSWTQVKQALHEHWLVVPVGSIEQHGPHLPLEVDTVLSEHIAWDLSKEIRAVAAPAVAFGARSLPNSGGGPGYPGTIYLQGNVLTDVYDNIIRGYISSGARKLLFLNAHFENEAFLVEAIGRCRESNALAGVVVLALSWWGVVKDNEMAGIFGQFKGWHVEHAGQAETALMLHYAPEQVRMDLAIDCTEDIPAGVYQHPTPPSWTGNEGVLSPTRHATGGMGARLAGIITTRLAALMRQAEQAGHK